MSVTPGSAENATSKSGTSDPVGSSHGETPPASVTTVNRSRTAGPRHPRRWQLPRQKGPEPAWWIKEVLFAALVAVLAGGALFMVQTRADDQRQEQAIEFENQLQQQAERLENLRFIRERSSTDASQPRPFGRLDLRGQSLSGLQLAGAHFEDSDLEGASLFGTTLTDAWFAFTNLRGTDLSLAVLNGAVLLGADLSGSTLYNSTLVGADLRAAILIGADLSTADLTDANLNGEDATGLDLSGSGSPDASLANTDLLGPCYDDTTLWPAGYSPPPSRTRNCPSSN